MSLARSTVCRAVALGAAALLCAGGLARGAEGAQLVSAVSRNAPQAGTPQDFPLVLEVPIGGAISVEARPVRPGHQIVLAFDTAITSIDVLSVLDESGRGVAGATHHIDGSTVKLVLQSVRDRSRMRIVLEGINGTSATASAALGFLLGDADGSAAVDPSEVGAFKARAGQTANGDNARFDLNASGTITAADVAGVKARVGGRLAEAQPVVAAAAGTVAVATAVPAAAQANIAEIISAFDNRPPGTAMDVAAAGGSNGLIFALDSAGRVVLASVEGAPQTQLSAESTALAFARIAFGPLRGVNAGQLNAAIGAAPGFPALTNAVHAALAAGTAPIDSPAVINGVMAVLNGIAVTPSSGTGVEAGPGMAAAPNETARNETSVTPPCGVRNGDILSELEVRCSMAQVSESPALSFDLRDDRTVRNRMPIAWAVGAYGVNDELLTPPPPAGEARIAGSWLIVPPIGSIGELLFPPSFALPDNGGLGMRVVLKQNLDSRVRNLADIARGVFGLALDASFASLDSDCTEAFLRGPLETLSLAQLAQLNETDNLAAFLDAIEIPDLVLSCFKRATQPGKAVFAKRKLIRVISRLLFAFQVASVASDLALLAGKTALTVRYWNMDPGKSLRICEVATGGMSREIRRCPSGFLVSPSRLTMVEGAQVDFHYLLGVNPANEVVGAAPIGAVLTTDHPQVVEAIGERRIRARSVGATKARLNYAFIGAGTSDVNAADIRVVRPQLRPAGATLAVGEFLRFELVDSQGSIVNTGGTGMQWYSTNAAVVDIPELQNFLSQPAATVRAVAPGTAKVIAQNPNLPLGVYAEATITVLQGGHWEISYSIAECEFVSPPGPEYELTAQFGSPCGIGTPVDGPNSIRRIYFDDHSDDVVFQSVAANAGFVRTVKPLAFRSNQNQFAWTTGAGISLTYAVPFSTETGVYTASGTRSYNFVVTQRSEAAMQGTFTIDGIGVVGRAANGLEPHWFQGPTISRGNWTAIYRTGLRPQTRLFGDEFCFHNDTSMPQMAFPLGPGNPRIQPGWAAVEGQVPTGCVFGRM
jgi:hypothetical protein